MNTTHTLGPWKCLKDAGGISIVPCIAYPPTIAEVSPDKTGKITEQQYISNATLIAAAPDLLEALEHVLSKIKASEHWWIDVPDRGGFDVELIESALKKAIVQPSP